MPAITITLSEEQLRELRELAEEVNVTPEDLVRASVEEWLRRPNDDFARAAMYVLEKNAALYRRWEHRGSERWALLRHDAAADRANVRNPC
jgi:hypothetical protein